MQLRELTDRYQLQKIVKSTRFGTVLRATDNRSGQTVAAKLITIGPSPGLAAGAPDFEKLAGILGSLRHPNLPTVLDSGFTPDGSAFLVLELLEGKGLDGISGLPPARVLKIAGQVLSGLEVLAGRGVAHHNLSPDNVFLATSPAGDQVKLLGLGTAIFRPRSSAIGGAVAPESARFLAPELLAGEPADWRADLYSLALTTCHALGATVGLGDAPVVQMPLAVSFELESDDALRQVLERCLLRRPAERATPREFREALLLALGNQAPAPQMPDLGTAAPVAALPSPATAAPLPPPAPMPAMPVIAPPVPFPAIAMAAAQPSLVSEPSPVPAGAAAAAGALPALNMPPLGEPLPEGDVLQSVDDEVLNALLSVPPPPPRTPKSGPAGAGAKVVPFLRNNKEAAPPPAPAEGAGPAPAATPSPWFLHPLLLGVLAGVLVLAGAAAVIWVLRRPQPVPTSPPKPAFVAKVPTQPPTAQLEEAKLYLAQGDDLKARRTLHALTFGEQGLLPPEGCSQLGAVQEALTRISLERLPSDLQSGLKTGDLEVLRNAVEAGSGQEAGLAPDVRASFDRARGIVDAYGQALVAAAQGNHVQVLERFASLQTLLPKMSDPEDLRGKAAAALEAEAEGLVKEAKYGAAVVQLEPLSRTWPDRPGLRERVAKYKSYQENETRQEALLAALPNIERRRKPSEALESMAGIEATPHLAPRFAEARRRFEDQLAKLDQTPPNLVLRDGFALDYSRGTVINLSFRATDDYQVKDVKLLARPQGGKMRELPLEKNRTGYYTVEIAPAFHQNETVDFYVVATDLSGHEAYLGSRDKPLQLKRKQGFERLIR
ncbi:MAG: eukaryotic-like serine/threonine-protein kinase [Acidobacteriota bacterium]|jgi:serine/threonine-protein kinase|nr:eukaryotic-like serine/threonine-protein kinase [Acidobacteriota bacterium]